ncbi:MAG: helix-turn-helix domain-containing protein, partial [Lachnospiraceae bacterium]|nr:helix-turn-helix domain-containing protein [Lachnospiraceae bacterium]
MDRSRIAQQIINARKKLNLTQKQLAEKLCVTNKAVSKWERGATIPDVTLLLPLSHVLGISVQQLLDSNYEEYGVSEEEILSRGCIGAPLPDGTQDCNCRPGVLNLHIDTNDLTHSSPYIFSHNLEHTRGALYGGLSAQLLRNRKFAGRPQARLGVAADWFGIGGRAFFCNDIDPYVRHCRENKMWRRNELNAQTVQNPVEGETAGIGQQGIFLQASGRYIAAAVVKSNVSLELSICLTDRSGARVYDEKTVSVTAGDWQRCEVCLISPADDPEGCLRLTFTAQAFAVFGAVSLLPENHFHGMRADVVKKMKEIGVGLLRWPGGNFAGEYRWQDMFLPVDQRAPLQAYTEDETQPYSHGYDMHEIDTDDYIALCREIGAEPYITVNLAWDTPEQCAAWVEYCNGPADSPYGSLRAERGHPEPYHVHFWSLGNEFGYGHMEGPMQPEQYAAMAKAAALKMLEVTPDLEICSSGQYQDLSRAGSWVEKSAVTLSAVSRYISLHTYNWIRHDYSSPG